jgi:hypothetical protein
MTPPAPFDQCNFEITHLDSATPHQGTQNPSLGVLITLHVPLHLFPLSATHRGSDSGYISHPSCPSTLPSARHHLVVIPCPHRPEEVKGEGEELELSGPLPESPERRTPPSLTTPVQLFYLHDIYSTRPQHATAPPSYHLNPHGEPCYSPHVVLSLLTVVN